MTERSEAAPGGSPIDEDRLHAYVDDRLDAAARAEIEAWLAKHPDEAARVRDWQAQIAALHAAFDPLLEAPVPDGLVRAAQPKPMGPVLRRVAAGLVLVAIGAAGGWFSARLAPSRPPGAPAERQLVADAVAAYRIYTVEVRHPVEVGAEQEPHLVAWLSKRLGSKIMAPDLAPLGYSLVGGRLLPGPDGPAAMLMYEGKDGRRLTCYIATNPDNRETAFQFRQNGDVSVFYWFDGPLGYALSGEVDRDRLLVAARAIYQQLEP